MIPTSPSSQAPLAPIHRRLRRSRPCDALGGSTLPQAS